MNNELLKKTTDTFNDSFINHNFELILVPKTNTYFRLDNIDSDIEFKCKILEWVSRTAHKGTPYKTERNNKMYREDILNKINKVLGTNFCGNDIEIIYCELGNCVDRDLTKKFVIGGYDLRILRGD